MHYSNSPTQNHPHPHYNHVAINPTSKYLKLTDLYQELLSNNTNTNKTTPPDKHNKNTTTSSMYSHHHYITNHSNKTPRDKLYQLNQYSGCISEGSLRKGRYFGEKGVDKEEEVGLGKGGQQRYLKERSQEEWGQGQTQQNQQATDQGMNRKNSLTRKNSILSHHYNNNYKKGILLTSPRKKPSPGPSINPLTKPPPSLISPPSPSPYQPTLHPLDNHQPLLTPQHLTNLPLQSQPPLSILARHANQINDHVLGQFQQPIGEERRARKVRHVM